MNVLTRLARHLDPHLLLTAGLCAFTLWPLLARPGLPNGDDVLYHVYRAAEMERAWSHGVLFPRWAESFYTGYGAPLFHYYASLSYYVTSLLSRLFAADAVNSLRLLIALCMLGAGVGMYGFVRAYAGKAGGVIAALAYVYSPYLLYTEPYSRGVYPELMAFALFPLIMWAYSRLLRTGRAGAFALAALGSGLLIITHNLMALVLTGLLLGWLGWGVVVIGYRLSVISKRSEKFDSSSQTRFAPPLYRRAGRLFAFTKISARRVERGPGGEVELQRQGLALLAAGLGVGLAAYFWLPVMREGGAVRLGNLTAVAQLDYRNFFVPLNHLLAFSPRMDAGAFNGLEHQFNLGVPQWTLALTGMVGLLILFVKQRRAKEDLSAPNPYKTSEFSVSGTRRSVLSTALFFALAALVTIFLMLPAAAPVWAGTAPLAFLQFPWRFLGVAAFALAMLAGMNAVWLERLWGNVSANHKPPEVASPPPLYRRAERLQLSYKFLRDEWRGGRGVRFFGRALAAAVVVYIIALAAPLLVVTEWIHPTVDSSVAAYQQAEVQGLQRATTFSNEYLPAAVAVEPDVTPRLLMDYADGYPINKVHVETLPPAVTVEVLEHSPQQDVWRVNAPAAFTLEVLTYDWPGWTAEVDGQAVPIAPSDPHGLITLPVPAGEHTVRVYLGSTPARDIGNAITLFSVIALSIISFYVWRKNAVLVTRHSSLISHNSALGTRYFFIGSLLTAAFLIFYLREGVGWVNSLPSTAQLAQHQTAYALGDHIRLIGYDLNSETFSPGERMELKLYWYAASPIPYGYNSFVHITAGGPPLAQADKLNPAGLPTVTWPSSGFIHDDYVIDLPADLPAGEYQVFVGLYTCDTRPAGECGNGERLTVTDASGQGLGDAVPLARISLR